MMIFQFYGVSRALVSGVIIHKHQIYAFVQRMRLPLQHHHVLSKDRQSNNSDTQVSNREDSKPNDEQARYARASNTMTYDTT